MSAQPQEATPPAPGAPATPGDPARCIFGTRVTFHLDEATSSCPTPSDMSTVQDLKDEFLRLRHDHALIVQTCQDSWDHAEPQQQHLIAVYLSRLTLEIIYKEAVLAATATATDTLPPAESLALRARMVDDGMSMYCRPCRKWLNSHEEKKFHHWRKDEVVV